MTPHKDKFMSIESPKKAFWLAPNVTNTQKKVPRYPQPCNLVPRAIFSKKELFSPAYMEVPEFLWRCSRDSEIIKFFILEISLSLT